MSVTGFAANYSPADREKSSWDISVDGRYATAVSEYLISDGIPETGVSKIMENAAKTLSYGPNPCDNSVCQKTGIVIGKVQSGKTSNFIALTALAFDNGYNLVVVLGGTKKILVTQNRDRIKEYFVRTKEVLVLDTVEYKDELTTNKLQQHIRNGKRIIIVALKSPAQINYVKNNVFKGSSFVDKPILIIDDEGDEASLNTLVKKGKKSSTYSAIEGLKSILNRHCFVSVTATPQANLLIDTLDVLSPDFGILVDPGNGYCGLDVFHSDNTYTVEIPPKETSLLDEGIPKSFISALAMFFVACALRKQRGMEPGDKLSMLIHPSQLKADHSAVHKKVTSLINQWIDCSNNKNDIAYEEVKEILVRAYDEYAKSTVKHIPPFSDLEDDIIQSINYCGIHKVNGDVVSKSADDIYDYNIYVGGAMLGRGLTLKGLAITYIIRTSKGASNVDTVQQRARWFGYKRKYLDLCRVFAVSKILNEFKHIRDHEEDLWYTVKQSNMQGENFKNMIRVFALSDDLRMTRQSIGVTERFTFNSWNKQRVFQNDPNYISSNMHVLSTFRKEYEVSGEIKQFGSGAPYYVIPSDFSVVFDKILNKFLFPSGSTLNSPLMIKLKALLDRKSLNPVIDVIWMRDKTDTYSKHDIRDDGGIPNYSVGRRPDDYSKPAVYLGDDYQFVKDNSMQLQIHMIQDRKSGVVSPTLALFLPNAVIAQLTNLVIKA